MTGYWTKSFDIGGVTRTAKVCISPETPIRSYYTVIAVPNGVDTADFLRTSSWHDIADEREVAGRHATAGQRRGQHRRDHLDVLFHNLDSAVAYYESVGIGP
ncbi:hypothetical protein ACQPYA_12975 [Micromonospora sp. CA-263727]|uniref:hypothetical protein n=1 Tax=Micromonospora sp. CA-263727 TaxID=3239967 RepID=UPI003D8F8A75